MDKKWYEKNGIDGDVVISTRVRLARNLEDHPFPERCGRSLREEIVKKVNDAVLGSNSVISSRFTAIDPDSLSAEEKYSLVEKHLASNEFMDDNRVRELLLLDDESVSIMVNEEDHIRLQVMCEGFDLDRVYEAASRIDTLLDERLKFAFSDTLGYLTQCPTNLGTGMRASVMLHLPALHAAKAMGKMTENLAKLGITVRGAYGEGSEPEGELYQLSNQITLGISERTAIENLKNITRQIIEQELKTRKAMAERLEVQDRIYRAEGILRSARLMDSREAQKLLSAVRFGVTVGLIKGVSLDTINRLMIEKGPANLIAAAGRKLLPNERDEARATLIRNSLNGEA